MWFTLTSCDPGEKSRLAILHGRISMRRQESAPHKVRLNHIIVREPDRGQDHGIGSVDSEGDAPVSLGHHLH